MSVEPLTYDTAPIGESVGPIAYTIPADYNRCRLASLGLAEDAFLPGTGWAEPSLLCGQHSWVMRNAIPGTAASMPNVRSRSSSQYCSARAST
jgi:hypothetical protein